MKSIFTTVIILMTLTACTSFRVQTTESVGTNMPQAGIPNPASVYCEENGNQHKILTAEDGSQSGICVFPDGSICDEWAYFRGECGVKEQETLSITPTVEQTENASGGYMAPGTAEEIADWWGVIKSTTAGAQYDDYFERQDLGGTIAFGIDSVDPTVQAQIAELRDSGKIVHLYGILLSNVLDYNGSQIQVERIEIEN